MYSFGLKRRRRIRVTFIAVRHIIIAVSGLDAWKDKMEIPLLVLKHRHTGIHPAGDDQMQGHRLFFRRPHTKVASVLMNAGIVHAMGLMKRIAILRVARPVLRLHLGRSYFLSSCSTVREMYPQRWSL